MKKNRKSALIVEGGGMRCIFAAGVLHAFGKSGFDPFDLYMGVSAGACHLASHLAGQNDRNFDITLRYSLSPRFISLGRFIKGGHLMDLDWMWDQTITHYRLDLKHIDNKLLLENKEYIVVITSMETGAPIYLRPDQNTMEYYIKISSSMPILYRNILELNGEKATDGGMADSIPVHEAYRLGAKDITVIRSRPKDYTKKTSLISLAFFSFYFRMYPHLVKAFRRRANLYNASVKFIHQPPQDVRIHEIAPPKTLDVGRTTNNESVLRHAYETGIEYGNRFIESHVIHH